MKQREMISSQQVIVRTDLLTELINELGQEIHKIEEEDMDISKLKTLLIVLITQLMAFAGSEISAQSNSEAIMKKSFEENIKHFFNILIAFSGIFAVLPAVEKKDLEELSALVKKTRGLYDLGEAEENADSLAASFTVLAQ
jgi:hypothetical protein